MADVVLNSAVRSNLRTLQSTTELLNQTEERLATGKKVNSALDNPASFFTANALDRRAGDLSSLLDSVASSVKTLEAADNGIKAITEIVEGLKATARAALQAPLAVDEKAFVGTIAAANVTATDLTNAGANTLNNKTITYTNERTAATGTITISSTGVNSLATLNAELEKGGLQAKLEDGVLTIETLNENANQTMVGAATAATGELVIGGTAIGATAAAVTTALGAHGVPKLNAEAALKRANLADDYNASMKEINTLAKDANYNGVNLLMGDDLDVIFNEDGSSKLDVKGVQFDANGVGIDAIGKADFYDSFSINSVLDKIEKSFKTIEAQSSKFGSQLQIVQTREVFTKDMIGTLEDGANSLTAADTNEEAANLATLQTRQQLIVTSLSISTQQESAVLQLLR